MPDIIPLTRTDVPHTSPECPECERLAKLTTEAERQRDRSRMTDLAVLLTRHLAVAQ
jgi:transposase